MEIVEARKTIGFAVKLNDFVEIHNIIKDSMKDWRVIIKGTSKETEKCLKGDMVLYLIRHGSNQLKILRSQKEARDKNER